MPAAKRTHIRARKLPKTLSGEEVAALMGRPNVNCPTGLRNRAMLALMHGCGLRVGECCALHLRDVNWKAGELRMRPEITKGEREAVVYAEEATIAWLERWKAVRRRHAKGSPLLFVTLAGGQVSPHYAWEMVGRYARKAGIENHVHPHMLRHTYATELLGEKFNIREVQKLLRHSDIRTTAIYLEIRDEQLREKVRRRGSETRG